MELKGKLSDLQEAIADSYKNEQEAQQQLKDLQKQQSDLEAKKEMEAPEQTGNKAISQVQQHKAMLEGIPQELKNKHGGKLELAIKALEAHAQAFEFLAELRKEAEDFKQQQQQQHKEDQPVETLKVDKDGDGTTPVPTHGAASNAPSDQPMAMSVDELEQAIEESFPEEFEGLEGAAKAEKRKKLTKSFNTMQKKSMVKKAIDKGSGG